MTIKSTVRVAFFARPPRVIEEAPSGDAVGVPSSIRRVQVHRQFETLLLVSE